MLFHGLSGSEMHGVIDDMDRRVKNDSAAISSAIDMGETETNMPSISSGRVALCAGCGGKISERYYLLAVDKQWHMRCLKCCECKLNLESELTCFSKDGNIYCKEDYYRRFSVQRCARCHLGISASEMVMRARDVVYHLNCFTCTTCNKMLTTGDHFGMKDNLVYCRLHFESLIQGEYQAHFSHADIASNKSGGLGSGTGNTLGLPYYNGVGTVQKGRPRKRKSPGPGADLAAYNAAAAVAAMLFHGLSGGEMHGVIDDMDRRVKSDSAAISSAIDMGETETQARPVASCGTWRGEFRRGWRLTSGKWLKRMPGLQKDFVFKKRAPVIIISFPLVELQCDGFLALSCNENDGDHLDRDSQYTSNQKTKRMRTSFKHHQLRTMKSYFAINHNPDAKDLKQLAQKTGLTKRVLQSQIQAEPFTTGNHGGGQSVGRVNTPRRDPFRTGVRHLERFPQPLKHSNYLN
ncbi:UNVERIFIED_CONTAM: hypothetical protein FKN15_059251 [Acipenser sinensis]